MENRFAVCFIASIIRSEIVQACKELDLETSCMIRKVDRIELAQLNTSFYIAIHNESGPAKDLLKRFDILPRDFNIIATDVNARHSSPIVSGVRKKPAHEGNNVKRKIGGPPKKDV